MEAKTDFAEGGIKGLDGPKPHLERYRQLNKSNPAAIRRLEAALEAAGRALNINEQGELEDPNAAPTVQIVRDFSECLRRLVAAGETSAVQRLERAIENNVPKQEAEALAAKLLEEAIGRAATNLEVAQASGDAAARKMWSEALNALNPMEKVKGGPLR